MANLTSTKHSLSDFNDGVKYVSGDGIQPDTINNTIENSQYAVDYATALGTNTPDVSDANNVGVPSVTILNSGTNNPTFKFSNLKGNTGNTGNTGLTGATGETGLSALTKNVIFTNATPPILNTQYVQGSGTFNRTPVVGDYFQMLWKNTTNSNTYMVVARVDAVVTTSVTVYILASTNITGQTGNNGADGASIVSATLTQVS